MPQENRCEEGYRVLDAGGVRSYLAGCRGSAAALGLRLGGSPGEWTVREVSDGNLNSVFLVEGPAGGLCVKQSLPHVRVDTSWKLPLDRAFFEAAWLRAVAPHAGGAVPRLHHYDTGLFCLVMERLSPHRILRGALIAGETYPRVAADLGRTVARISFHTSPLGRPFEPVMDDIALFAKNQTLARITVDLVLTDPYRISRRNRWTSPELDMVAAGVREDAALKSAAARLGARFLGAPQALLHGDLHTGSVMVTDDDTRIIDGEFAMFGPIGFDLGLFTANLLLNVFATAGERTAAAHRDWALAQVAVFWNSFAGEFAGLWSSRAGTGDVMPPALLDDPDALAGLQRSYLDEIWRDTVGFAGMEIIRRILGFAHVADLEQIADRRLRAARETAAIGFARALLVEPWRFDGAAALALAAREACEIVDLS